MKAKGMIDPIRFRLARAARRGLVCVVALLSVLGLAAPDASGKTWEELSGQCCDNAEGVVIYLGKAATLNLPRAAADIVISDPKIIDVVLRTAEQPVLFGMRIGQANILFFDENNREMRVLEVRVEYDVSLLNHTLRSQFPTASVTAQSVMGEVILEGSAMSGQDAAAIVDVAERFVAAARSSQSGDGAVQAVNRNATGVVNRIRVANGEQIHLRVRVAEVNRSVLRNLGVDWNAGLQSAQLSSTLLLSGGSIGGFLSATGSQVQVGPEALSSFLQALEQHSLVVTLAEPSLTAVSGETASFLAGGEYPIPVSSQDGQVAVEFKSFGVGLDFTPIALEDGRVSLRVATEVSDLTTNGAVTVGGIDILALSVRRAESTVELPSGGTIMIAGLIQQSTRRLSAGLPGMRDLPVIGQFFRTEQSEIDETELVILVTPYLVKPGAPEEFVAPTDGFRPASDIDMYVFGRLHAVYGVGPEDAARVRAQAEAMPVPLGFIME